MHDFESDQPLEWCIVFFLLIFLGEQAPLALLFNYQIRKNIIQAERNNTVITGGEGTVRSSARTIADGLLSQYEGENIYEIEDEDLVLIERAKESE